MLRDMASSAGKLRHYSSRSSTLVVCVQQSKSVKQALQPTNRRSTYSTLHTYISDIPFYTSTTSSTHLCHICSINAILCALDALSSSCIQHSCWMFAEVKKEAMHLEYLTFDLTAIYHSACEYLSVAHAGQPYA